MRLAENLHGRRSQEKRVHYVYSRVVETINREAYNESNPAISRQCFSTGGI